MHAKVMPEPAQQHQARVECACVIASTSTADDGREAREGADIADMPDEERREETARREAQP